MFRLTSWDVFHLVSLKFFLIMIVILASLVINLIWNLYVRFPKFSNVNVGFAVKSETWTFLSQSSLARALSFFNWEWKHSGLLSKKCNPWVNTTLHMCAWVEGRKKSKFSLSSQNIKLPWLSFLSYFPRCLYL